MIIRSFGKNNFPGQENKSTLTLWKVPPGTGTAGNDLNYCYRFTSPTLPTDGGGSLTVSVEAEDDSFNPYVIYSYASTSPGIILIPGPIPLPFSPADGKKSISFDLQLRANELVLLSIIIIDTSKTPAEPYDLICCDPQVANDAKT